MLGAPVGNGIGVSELNEDRRVIARGGAFTNGQIGQFDFARTNAATTNYTPGDPNSSLVNVVQVYSGGNQAGVLCAFLENTDENLKGKVRLRGAHRLYVVKSSGNISPGDVLYAVSGQKYLSANPSAGDRAVAIAKETITSPTTPQLCYCLFDLVNGVASFVS